MGFANNAMMAIAQAFSLVWDLLVVFGGMFGFIVAFGDEWPQ